MTPTTRAVLTALMAAGFPAAAKADPTLPVPAANAITQCLVQNGFGPLPAVPVSLPGAATPVWSVPASPTGTAGGSWRAQPTADTTPGAGTTPDAGTAGGANGGAGLQCGGLIINTTLYIVTVTVTTTTTTVTAPINAAAGSITTTTTAPAPATDGQTEASPSPAAAPSTSRAPQRTAAPPAGASGVGMALRAHGTVRSRRRTPAHVRRVVRIRLVKVGRAPRDS
jgi:hypothetical protein